MSCAPSIVPDPTQLHLLCLTAEATCVAVTVRSPPQRPTVPCVASLPHASIIVTCAALRSALARHCHVTGAGCPQVLLRQPQLCASDLYQTTLRNGRSLCAPDPPVGSVVYRRGVCFGWCSGRSLPPGAGAERHTSCPASPHPRLSRHRQHDLVEGRIHRLKLRESQHEWPRQLRHSQTKGALRSSERPASRA